LAVTPGLSTLLVAHHDGAAAKIANGTSVTNMMPAKRRLETTPAAFFEAKNFIGKEQFPDLRNAKGKVR
jgi:hypothetical protein